MSLQNVSFKGMNIDENSAVSQELEIVLRENLSLNHCICQSKSKKEVGETITKVRVGTNLGRA